MDCLESEKMMSAYVDGELDPSAASGFAEHLAACNACRRIHQELLSMRSMLKSHATQYSAPSHLRHRIQADLDAGRAGRSKPGKMPWAWINFGVATACSFAFALTLSIYLKTPSENDRLDQEIVASHYRSLLAEHLTDVTSSDRHTVKPWFSGKLDYSPPVVDLARQGFPLIGGRLDYVNRRSVAALAYRHGQHFLNLFIWPDIAGRDAPARMTSIQGFHLLQWAHSGMTYRAISDMSSQEVVAFQTLLMQAKPE